MSFELPLTALDIDGMKLMAKITACVITYNEQKQIVPLLKNLYPLFDEVVIVDGISVDKTIKLIEDFRSEYDEQNKVKLFLFTQEGARYTPGWKQSAQRNLALEKATGDWILFIDADERLDGDARVRLEDAANGDYIAYALPTYHYWETETEIRVDDFWYPNYHYRFWKNLPADDRTRIRYSRHARHCFPIVRKYPEVRGFKEVVTKPPCLNTVPIHHYHHVPIKKKPTGGYRANMRDVRTMAELLKGLETQAVELRKKGPMEE